MEVDANEPLVCLRWVVHGAGRGNRFRLWERLVDEVVAPAVRALVAAPVESVHVAKRLTEQDRPAVWLAAFAPPREAEAVRRAVAAHLRGWRTECLETDDPDREEMLRRECRRFRRGVAQVTRAALDLHRPAVRRESQKRLIEIGVRDRTDRRRLHALLRRASPTYRALDRRGREEFWNLFTHSCPRRRDVDCGHWLYNIVLGVDWFEMHDPSVVAAYVGISRRD